MRREFDEKTAILKKALVRILMEPMSKEAATKLAEAGEQMLEVAEKSGASAAYLDIVGMLDKAAEYSAALIVLDDLLGRVLPAQGITPDDILIALRREIAERGAHHKTH
jgi:hypothetical protein